MDPISPQELLARPLRVHSFLLGVPLHDVWAVDLPPLCEGVTLQEFLRRISKVEALGNISWPTRMLLGLRIALGRVFGWDREPQDRSRRSFSDRLTDEDRARSSVAAGTPEGFFHTLYSFENEVLREVANQTVHAAALFALFRTETAYRLYFAIYVQKVSWMTPVYMWLIGPFRRWIVYPAIFRQLRRNWDETFAKS